MSTVPSRRTSLCVALGLTLAALAGCQAETQDAAPTAVQTPFSQELHDRLPRAVQASDELTVLTSAGYPPVMFYGPDGRTLQGSEADLAAGLGRVLGVSITFVPAEFPTILDRLARGEADLGMSGITDTAERQAKVDFVDYFEAGTAILVQRGNEQEITDLSGLCGQRVSVGEGTTHELLATRLQASCGDAPIVVTQSTTAADALLELRAGNVQATLVDYPPAANMASDPKTRSSFELATTEQYETAPFGIAVSKTEPDLAPVLQEALSQMQTSGEYEEVLRRWSLEAGLLSTIGLNTGT